MFLCSVLAVGAPWVAASVRGEAVMHSGSEDDLGDAGWDLHYALTPSMMVEHFQAKNEATASLQQFTTSTNAYQALASINYGNRHAMPRKPTTNSGNANVTHHVIGLVGTVLFLVLCSTLAQGALLKGVHSAAARMWVYLSVVAADVAIFVFTTSALGAWAHAGVKAAACAHWTGKGAVTPNQTTQCGYSDGYNAAIVLVVFSVFHLAVWAYGLRGDAVGELASAQGASGMGPWGGAADSGMPPSSAESMKQPLASSAEGDIEGAYQVGI